jgi:hypothetical protein
MNLDVEEKVSRVSVPLAVAGRFLTSSDPPATAGGTDMVPLNHKSL